ncbi:GRIP and coiled-coil domain-containing protein 2-like, partial [Asbolus verrucosus]
QADKRGYPPYPHPSYLPHYMYPYSLPPYYGPGVYGRGYIVPPVYHAPPMPIAVRHDAPSCSWAVEPPRDSEHRDDNITVALDNVTLQEQVQKLQHQLQKTTNELDLVKQQLVVAEEQNDSLSADLLKFQKLQHWQNTYLRNKMQKYEKIRFERKKSVSEIKDELDIKETEISTLMEIIEEMKSKLDEKTELVTFYINENNMLKQRALALENLLKEIFPDGNVSLKSQEGADSLMIFNTPKLLRQLANPISPTICTPLTDPKTCNTSSPIKHDTSIDLFSSAGIVTVLRTPYKTLKEELLEVSDDKFVDDEVKRLQEVVKEQESIKNSLWENIKDLSNENKALQEYRKGYEKLVYNIQEKEDVIQHLRNELETSQVNLQEQKQFSSFDVTKESNCTKHDKGIETDTQQRANKSTATEVCEDKVQGLTLELESNKDKRNESTETDTWREKDEMIQRLKDDLKTLEASFQQEKQLNADLHKKYRKTVVDQSTQISKEETWNIPTAEVAESKKTNFAKQQMKMERLLEKQERIEKELANERGINTTLSLKLQGMREQNKQIKDDLEFHREKTSKQTEIIRTLLSEKRASEEKGQVLETENENLRKENSDLKDEKKSLTNEKHSLSQNLQNSLNRLAIEASLGNNARVENELLQNKLWQMEAKLKDECIKQIHMKKQIIDLKTTNNSKFIELERNLSEKENEIENLQKQIEVINIEVFLSVNNKELGRYHILFYDRVKAIMTNF